MIRQAPNAARAMWEPLVRHHRLRAALAPAHKAEQAMWELLARHHRRIEICRIGATPVMPGYFNKSSSTVLKIHRPADPRI